MRRYHGSLHYLGKEPLGKCLRCGSNLYRILIPSQLPSPCKYPTAILNPQFEVGNSPTLRRVTPSLKPNQ